MSILINGMEMPKKIEPGLVVEFADGIDGKRYARLHHYRHGALTDWLEAVHVPQHGRLIDADVLALELREKAKDFTDSEYGEGLKCGLADARVSITNAPTIIPADKEGEA